MNSHKRVSLQVISIFITACAASLAFAQQPSQVRLPQASPWAAVSQTIGITDISITYHRPSVKGRTVWGDISPAKVAELIKEKRVGPVAEAPEGTLDGATGSGKDIPLAPNGHVWRAGANEATKFTVSDDVLVNGQKLPAGTYSLHMIPGKEEWTVIFNKTADQFGSFRYDARQDALRVKTKPVWKSESQEVLSYEIPAIGANTARVVLRWEKAAVPFTVEVPNQDSLVRSKIDAAMAANPSDWQLPLNVANAYVNDDKLEDALPWIDKSIKVKETFQNLRARASLLFSMGKKPEAIAAGEKAVARGKADGVDTARLEKLLAEVKAGMR